MLWLLLSLAVTAAAVTLAVVAGLGTYRRVRVLTRAVSVAGERASAASEGLDRGLPGGLAGSAARLPGRPASARPSSGGPTSADGGELAERVRQGRPSTG